MNKSIKLSIHALAPSYKIKNLLICSVITFSFWHTWSTPLERPGEASCSNDSSDCLNAQFENVVSNSNMK